jgi:hypothetical protein
MCGSDEEKQKELEIQISRMMQFLDETHLSNVMRDAALIKAGMYSCLDLEDRDALYTSLRVFIKSDGKHGIKKFSRVITF